mgnify:CR=1 FL=1
MITAKLRICAAILALASAGAVLASCGSSDAGETKTTEANTTADTATVTEEVTTDYMPAFPEKDYGGDEFMFLTSSDADDNGVCGSRRISQCKSCRRAGGDKHGLADTCANGVDGDKILVGELTVLHDLYLHKLAAYQGVLLSCGHDVSSDNST